MGMSQTSAATGDSLAWHYTSGQCAAQILQSGIILPAHENVPRGEKPALWFSLNKFWEPTASKGTFDPITRVRRFATMEEMDRIAGGCYRFGIQSSRLLCWSALKVKTRMRMKTIRALERVAHEVSSDPSHWMGIMEAIPVSEVVVIQNFINGSWNVFPELALQKPHIGRHEREQGFTHSQVKTLSPEERDLASSRQNQDNGRQGSGQIFHFSLPLHLEVSRVHIANPVV